MLDNHLLAHHLFTVQPHIFVSKTNPLAKKTRSNWLIWKIFLTLPDQGTHNSFTFLVRFFHKKHKKSIVNKDQPPF